MPARLLSLRRLLAQKLGNVAKIKFLLRLCCLVSRLWLGHWLLLFLLFVLFKQFRHLIRLEFRLCLFRRLGGRLGLRRSRLWRDRFRLFADLRLRWRSGSLLGRRRSWLGPCGFLGRPRSGHWSAAL